MNTVNCPLCGHQQPVEAHDAGMTLPCSRCGSFIEVPELAAPLGQPYPPAGTGRPLANQPFPQNPYPAQFNPGAARVVSSGSGKSVLIALGIVGGLFVFMVLALAAIPLLAMSGPVEAGDFQVYDSVAGRYTVSMPGKPRIETSDVVTGAGVQSVQVAEVVRGKHEYATSHIHFVAPSDKYVTLNAKDAIEGIREEANATIISSTVARNQQGLNGMEALMRVPDGRNLHALVYLRQQTVYAMVVVTSADRNAPGVSIFFDSFFAK